MLLALSLGWQVLISPRRRRYMGVLKFTAAAALVYGAPLFGVIVLRAGWRHAYLDAGRGWWSALWLSLFWMIAFLVAARLVLRLVPPFSWLMREWRQAQAEGLRMLFGFQPRSEGVVSPRPAAPRFVGSSSFAGGGALNPSRRRR